ncbi:T-cell immunoglobulin and mucin domain-containing protein 4 isoform X1 [Enhydra lutris kenyoni]|uniref:T-cell immunoglobulin and mucin domain-containing protein 4 isoform X1 n=1 Tax=Enhydra lutris kenyoni TaxID=391180 RepID=UPI000BB52744|nr:T-cell immunoglobulin and mucin domain-containing protein 4 isoform X1 [Enhydra lutris kenyoni]
MSKGPLILWLLIELGRLSLSSAAEETVRAYLGQTVTLPCIYSSWSHNRNSMCWGKGECPKSKCNNELLYTNGKSVLSKKSPKYELLGTIWRGDVSLTIFNTNEDDSSVYCCRIEVPGWFNDVKKNIRLRLMRAPSTRRSTTRLPTTTTALTTTTAVLPTRAMITPELTTRTPLQTRTTTALTTVATTCPPATSTFLSEATTVLPTTELSMEGTILTAESETFFLSKDPEISTEVTSGSTALLTSKESEAWFFQSTSQASMWETSDPVTFPQTGATETEMPVQNGVESEQVKMINSDLLMIIAPSLGFVLLALLVALSLQGKVMKTSCFSKHTRLDSVGECKNNFGDMQHGREDEDGLFTL